MYLICSFSYLQSENLQVCLHGNDCLLPTFRFRYGVQVKCTFPLNIHELVSIYETCGSFCQTVCKPVAGMWKAQWWDVQRRPPGTFPPLLLLNLMTRIGQGCQPGWRGRETSSLVLLVLEWLECTINNFIGGHWGHCRKSSWLRFIVTERNKLARSVTVNYCMFT